MRLDDHHNNEGTERLPDDDNDDGVLLILLLLLCCRIWRNRGAPPAEFGEADQVIRCSCNLAESTISQVDQHLTTSSSSTVAQGGVGHGQERDCWARPRPWPGVHLLGDAGCGEEVRRAARSAAAGRCRMRRGGETRGQERGCWARRGAGTSAWTQVASAGRASEAGTSAWTRAWTRAGRPGRGIERPNDARKTIDWKFE